MKILVTGMTRIQTGSARLYTSFASELASALKELGHEVDWRSVRAGEELRGRYDMALVGFSSLLAFSSHYRFGAIWASRELPTLHFHDDWGFQRHRSNYRNSSAALRRQGMDAHAAYDLEKVLAKHPDFEDYVRKWTSDTDLGLKDAFIGMYTYGLESSMRKLWPIRTLYRWDPSPCMTPTSVIIPETKRRMWVCATLSNQDEWIDKRTYEWPVYRFYKAVGMAFPERLSELELVQKLFAPNWGALVYRQARLLSGGFWRPRHHLAMWAGMIQWGEAIETLPIGPSWGTMLSEIERMSDDELRDLATRQRHEFTGHWMTREESLKDLQSELERWMITEGL